MIEVAILCVWMSYGPQCIPFTSLMTCLEAGERLATEVIEESQCETVSLLDPSVGAAAPQYAPKPEMKP